MVKHTYTCLIFSARELSIDIQNPWHLVSINLPVSSVGIDSGYWGLLLKQFEKIHNFLLKLSSQFKILNIFPMETPSKKMRFKPPDSRQRKVHNYHHWFVCQFQGIQGKLMLADKFFFKSKLHLNRSMVHHNISKYREE